MFKLYYLLPVLILGLLVFGCVSQSQVQTKYVCWDGSVKDNQSACGVQPVVYQNVTTYVCWDNSTVTNPIFCPTQPPQMTVVTQYVCGNGNVVNNSNECVAQIMITQTANYTEKLVDQTKNVTSWWSNNNIVASITLEKARFYYPVTDIFQPNLQNVQQIVVYMGVNNQGTDSFSGNELNQCYLNDSLGDLAYHPDTNSMDVMNGEYPYSIGVVPPQTMASEGLVFQNVNDNATNYTLTCPDGFYTTSNSPVFTFSK